MSTSMETRSLAGNNIRAASSPGVGYRGNARSAQVVANWHDETHSGAFTMCQEQPCAAVRTVDVEPSK